MMEESGFLVVDKPSGMTSHDLVAKVRKRFGTKRVGHAGTLDPMATGVLVIGINNATKFLQFIVEGRKRYIAIIRLGIATVTDDKEGEVVATREWSSVSNEQINQALSSFVGKIRQVPSSVSAIKVQGERAYDLVRQGKEVSLEAREVTIDEIKVLAIHRDEYLDIDIDVSCSAGTYIRAIARDLGNELGVGGHLIELRRVEVAPFSLQDSENWESAKLIPLAEAITKVMSVRELNFEELSEIKFGRQIEKSETDGAVAALAPNGEVAAILENRGDRAQPVSVFVKE